MLNHDEFFEILATLLYGRSRFSPPDGSKAEVYPSDIWTGVEVSPLSRSTVSPLLYSRMCSSQKVERDLAQYKVFSRKSSFESAAYAEKGMVERKALQRVIHGHWLNDVVIDDHLQRCIDSQKDSSKICALPSGYFLNGKINPAILKELPSVHGGRKNLREKMLEADSILCPISFNHHWYLMLISKPNNSSTVTLRCLDGYNNQNDEHSALFKQGMDIIQSLYGNTLDCISYDCQTYYVHEQNNTSDCGTVICYYGELFCQGKLGDKLKEPIGICDYSDYRNEIVSGLNRAAHEAQLGFSRSSHRPIRSRS